MVEAQTGHAEAHKQRACDSIAYWLSIVGIYLVQGALWYYPFKVKVFDDGLIAPARIKEQFDGSLIDSFPGTSVAWAILGLLQGVVVVTLVASLVRAEFLPSRRKPILLGALTLGLVAHALMLFGSSMTAEFDSVASLFTYFGVTVVLIVFVLLLPPYRPARWLSSLLPG